MQFEKLQKLLFQLMIVDLPLLGRHYFVIFRVEGKWSRISSSPRFRRERRSIPRAISKSASRMADGRAVGPWSVGQSCPARFTELDICIGGLHPSVTSPKILDFQIPSSLPTEMQKGATSSSSSPYQCGRPEWNALAAAPDSDSETGKKWGKKSNISRGMTSPKASPLHAFRITTSIPRQDGSLPHAFFNLLNVHKCLMFEDLEWQ